MTGVQTCALPIYIGSAPITVSAVEFSNALYFSRMDGGFMINPGEIMNLPISFAPTNIGPVECVITIPNSSTNNPNFWLNANGMGFEGFFHIVEPTGLPYTVVVDSLVGPMDSIQLGDEIGIFDGSTAVGVIVAGALNSESGYNLAGVAWQADPDNGLEGFTPGNPMTFRYFARRNGVAAIYDANHAVISGTGNFGAPPFTVVTLTSGSDPLAPVRILDIPDVSIMEDSGPDTVSDNLNDHFFHTYDSLDFGVLSNDTNAVNVSVDETASLIVTPLENWFGVVDIYVSATDGYFYAYDTVTVSVQNVNDAPQPFALEIVDSVFIDMDNINTDSLTLTWAVAGDTDGDPITYFFTAELRALEIAGGAVLFNMDTIISSRQAKVAYDLLAELIDEQELVNGELDRKSVV